MSSFSGVAVVAEAEEQPTSIAAASPMVVRAVLIRAVVRVLLFTVASFKGVFGVVDPARLFLPNCRLRCSKPTVWQK